MIFSRFINIEYLFMLDFSKSIKIEYPKSLESGSFINIERPESGDFTDSLTKDLPASKKRQGNGDKRQHLHVLPESQRR